MLGFDVYGKHHNEQWFQKTVMPLYRLGHVLSDARYWVMYRLVPSHRYHMINTGLEPGYYDEDMRILHGCFAMLGTYIKWHGGPEGLAAFTAELRADPDPALYQINHQEEAVKLWTWWTVERPADEKRHDELLTKLYGPREDGTERITWKPIEGKDTLNELVVNERPGDAALDQEFRALEKKIADDEQAMLHRLIDLRPSLWT